MGSLGQFQKPASGAVGKPSVYHEKDSGGSAGERLSQTEAAAAAQEEVFAGEGAPDTRPPGTPTSYANVSADISSDYPASSPGSPPLPGFLIALEREQHPSVRSPVLGGSSPAEIASGQAAAKHRPSRLLKPQFSERMTDNLLLELRVGQKRISDLEIELERALADAHAAQTAKLDMVKKLDEQQTVNWNLEVEVQDLEARMAKDLEARRRLAVENEKLTAEYRRAVEDAETRRAHEAELQQQIDSQRVRFEQDISSKREMVDDYEEALKAAEQRVRQLEEEVRRQASAAKQAEAEPALQSPPSPSSPTTSPPLSPVRNAPSRSTALEADTHRTALAHLQKQLQKLRSQLRIERADKIELRRQLERAPQLIDMGSIATMDFAPLKEHDSLQDSVISVTSDASFVTATSGMSGDATPSRSDPMHGESGDSVGFQITPTPTITTPQHLREDTISDDSQTRPSWQQQSPRGSAKKRGFFSKLRRSRRQNSDSESDLGTFSGKHTMQKPSASSIDRSGNDATAERTLDLASALETKEVPFSQLANLAYERGLVLLSKIEYENNVLHTGYTAVARDELETLRNPTVDRLKELAYSHGLQIILEPPSPDTLADLLQKYPPTMEQVASLAEKYGRRMVDVDAANIALLAKEVGLTALPEETLQNLENPELSTLMDALMRQGYVAISNQEYAELKRRANEPTLNEVRRFAASLFYALIPDAELAELQRRVDAPTTEEFEKAAQVMNCRFLSQAQIDELEERAKTQAVQSMTIGDLRAAAKERDLSLLTSDEYAALQLRVQKVDAADADFNVRQHDLFTQLTQRAGQARSRGEISIAPQEITKASNVLSDLGFVPVSVDCYRRLVAEQTVYVPRRRDVIEAASVFGLRTISADDYARIHDKDEISSHLSEEDDEKQDRFKVVPVEYLNELKHLAKEPTLQEVRSLASRLGFSLTPNTNESGPVRTHEPNLAQSELDVPHLQQHGPVSTQLNNIDSKTAHEHTMNISASHEELSDVNNAETLSRAKQLGFTAPRNTINDAEIIARARQLGLVREDEANERKVVPLSDDEIILRAKALGFVEAPNEDDIADFANKQGLVRGMSHEEFVARAREIGLVPPFSEKETLERAKEIGYTQKLSDEEIKQKAATMGYVQVPSKAQIIKIAERHGLVPAPTQEEIIMRARSLGLEAPLTDAQIIARAKQYNMQEPPTKQMIKERARALGLVEPITETEFIARARALGYMPALSNAQIIAKAKQMGMVEAPTDRQIIMKAKSEGFVERPTEQQVRARARRLGMVDPANASSSKQDFHAQPQRAALQARSSTTAAAAAAAPSTPAATSRGAPQKERRYEFLHLPTPTRTPQNQRPTSSYLPVSRPREDVNTHRFSSPLSIGSTHAAPLASSAAVAASSSPRNSAAPLARNSICTSGTSPRQQPLAPLPTTLRRPLSVASNLTAENYFRRLDRHTGLPSFRRSDVGRKQSLESSVQSLDLDDHQHMMSLITQLIIGEVLYKYVSGISIAGLTGGRHQRYFWVHPYSLTLYWMRDNPAAIGRVSKPKAAPIIAVEETSDYNPLPPGLFYKSIIITSTHRTVKVTCQNRRRHQVWLAALRFLLKNAESSHTEQELRELERSMLEDHLAPSMPHDMTLIGTPRQRHSMPTSSGAAHRVLSTPVHSRVLVPARGHAPEPEEELVPDNLSSVSPASGPTSGNSSPTKSLTATPGALAD